MAITSEMTHVEWVITLLKYLAVTSCLGIGNLTGLYPTPAELLTGLLALAIVAVFVQLVLVSRRPTDGRSGY